MFNSLARIATALERLADLYAQDLANRNIVIRDHGKTFEYAVRSEPKRKPRVYHLEEEPEPVWPVQSPKS